MPRGPKGEKRPADARISVRAVKHCNENRDEREGHGSSPFDRMHSDTCVKVDRR
jgi:hypothetical protein